MYHRNISPTNFVIYQLIIIDYHCLSLIIIVCHRLSLIIIDYYWSSLIKIWKKWITNCLSDNLKARDAGASKKLTMLIKDLTVASWQQLDNRIFTAWRQIWTVNHRLGLLAYCVYFGKQNSSSGPLCPWQQTKFIFQEEQWIHQPKH